MNEIAPITAIHGSGCSHSGAGRSLAHYPTGWALACTACGASVAVLSAGAAEVFRRDIDGYEGLGLYPLERISERAEPEHLSVPRFSLPSDNRSGSFPRVLPSGRPKSRRLRGLCLVAARRWHRLPPLAG